ncbi:hypothetical protein PORY_001242 [Pneumocystis oryctolagi]|uniref:Uncharacterized protein n=1 Tax=Pneumocystis oryctolagi TaxID=42067 RepID=A0ACB7CBG3_9ASCO|nr:hypothetical protein PORY_001242 [Pneumocystis oryctolagi]
MYYAIVASKSKVQEIKDILNKNNLYDKYKGICKIEEEKFQENKSEKRIIYTLRKKSIKLQDANLRIEEIFPELKIDTTDLNLIVVESETKEKNIHNQLNIYIEKFIQKMYTKYKINEKLHFSKIHLRYTIYGDMALLSANSFLSSQWTFFSTLHPSDKLDFYKGIAENLGVTHLAMNAPIPHENPMRIPFAFIPLYGDFGPKILKKPTKKDYEEAFWVTIKQNGIYQTWSPMYTMFSRGNIKEKARILGFPDVKDSTIADLYAGIGYFAFSYLKAKAKKVFCWEINPWSIEGLSRGAKLNKFTFKKVDELNDNYDNQLIVFENTNALANEQLKGKIKNIRHINLGLLPKNEDSWPVAVKILDSKMGGWIHVHSTVCNKEIYSWAEKSKNKFIELFNNEWEVKIEHIEKVKQFSPKLLHIVVDLLCIPKKKIL